MEDKWKLFESTPIYNRSIEKYINVYKNEWEKRYYKCLFDIELFDIEIDDNRRREICINYLEGLEWTIKSMMIPLFLGRFLRTGTLTIPPHSTSCS